MHKLPNGLLAVSLLMYPMVPCDAAEPYAMRGLRLGSTKAEFKAFPIPNDSGALNTQAWCSDDILPKEISISSSSEERADGIVNCMWFSKSPYLKYSGPDQHWVDLGTGKGPPIFKFVSDGNDLRLFEISFYANTEYYSGIYDALISNYGKPEEKDEPFQTKAGATFVSKTSIWRNDISSISLTFRCRHTERYCLTYTHVSLAEIVRAKDRARKAEAASKI